MDTNKARDLPARLEGVRRRFEQWRATRKAHARIPDSLWASAAVMADRYGISRTAQALGVNYEALKKHLGPKPAANHHTLKRRIERRPAAANSELARSEAAQFVELPRFVSAADHFVVPDLRSVPGDCLLELEDGGGAKMRVRLRGVGMPDLAALGRSFWESTAKAASSRRRFRNRQP